MYPLAILVGRGGLYLPLYFVNCPMGTGGRGGGLDCEKGTFIKSNTTDIETERQTETER